MNEHSNDAASPAATTAVSQVAGDLFRRESARLVAMLAGQLETRAPQTHALLALKLLNAARLPARTDDAGNLLRLHEQDRSAWNRTMIERGMHYLALAATGDEISEYHLESGIAACHSTAADDAGTDWRRILALYDQLVKLNPSPVVALNRAVAVARVCGPQAGLDALDSIAARASLESYQLFHAVHGALAAELGRFAEALVHFRKAEALAALPSERKFISRRIRECEGWLVFYS